MESYPFMIHLVWMLLHLPVMGKILLEQGVCWRRYGIPFMLNISAIGTSPDYSLLLAPSMLNPKLILKLVARPFRKV